MLFLMLGITIFNKKTILKLKFTKRLLRLIILILASHVFVLINPMLYLVIELYFAPFILIIVNTLLIPLEALINKKYIEMIHKLFEKDQKALFSLLNSKPQMDNDFLLNFYRQYQLIFEKLDILQV